MRTIIRGVIAAGVVLLASFTQSLAIEGLRISVQGPDVILGWPSTGGENYIVQWRPNLNPGTPWVMLTNWLPADWTTNWTVFVDSNRVQYASGSTNNFVGGGGQPPPLPEGTSMARAAAQVSEPMVKPADGSGVAVPLCIYPPGSDLSGFIIFDPSTGEWVSGAGYIVPVPAFTQRLRNGPQPMDDSPGDTNSAPDPGFYQVVRQGVYIEGITNGVTLSGVVTIPVEAGNPDGQLVNLTLTEDDSPITGAPVQTPPFPPQLYLVVDTTQMSNGVHQIVASARWEGDDSDSAYEADSPPITVNVYNEISFPNWMGTFGSYDFGYGDSTNLLLIEAQSAHTNADFYIDVYDSQSNYIGTFAGNTPDGSIEAAWDLVGPYGETHYNDPFFSFVVTTVFNDPVTASATPPPIYRVTDPWSGYGAFVIAAQHAFDNILGSEDLYAEIDGFVGMARSYGVMPPPDADGHAFAIHFEPDPAASSDWAAFRSALFHPLARNLIYFGHGGPNGLGYHQSNTNLSIKATEIGARLGTMPATTNQHRFRLVLVDGCSTAKGKLPEAFGIIHQPNVSGITYYNASIRPSAFGGWTADKYVGILSAGVNYDHIHFIQWIQYYLALGEGIHDAVVHAGGMPDTYGLTTSQFKVYGYWDLSFWAFNN